MNMSTNQENGLSYCKSNVVASLQKLPQLKTIPEYLKHFAETQGQKEAFVLVSDSERLSVTWGELFIKSTTVAKAMIKLGVKKGDIIVIYLKDSLEYLYLMNGAYLAGACVIPFYYVDKSWENMESILQRVETCSMLVIEATDITALIENVIEQVDEDGRVMSGKFPYLRYLITHNVDENGSRSEGKPLHSLFVDINTEVELPQLYEDDLAGCHLSSGSTGPPKIIANTYKSFIIDSISRLDDMQQYLPDEDIIEYNERPFPWGGGQLRNIITGHCRVMCTITEANIADEARIQTVMDTIQTERCNYVFMLPSALPFFKGFKVPENWPVKMVRSGGQTFSNKCLDLLGIFTPAFFIVYSSGECRTVASKMVTTLDDFIPHKVGSLSSYKSIEVKIVDNNEVIVPLGVHGEIYVRTATSFKCYLQDPAGTEAVQTADGWNRTDDIGMLKDEDGTMQLYVISRKSNIIISNGNKIVPELLENIIEQRNSNIKQAKIVPIPDDIECQSLCSCVKMENGRLLDVDYMNQMFKKLQDEKPGDYKAITGCKSTGWWLIIFHC